MSDLKIPQFASETEEADWWYARREAVEDEFLRSASEGRVQRRPSLEQISGEDTGIPHQILIEPHDANLALDQARTRGLSFEEHARRLFHQAVQAEETRRAS